jgi:dolichyl-phosphate beta-glucosyltransferase
MMISLIIPAYNEEKRLSFILEAALGYFKNVDFSYEIIVVDDGSVDSTLAVLEKYSLVLPKLHILTNGKNQGKGIAVKNGMLAAKGDFCLFADADNSTPLEELDKFLIYFQQGYDVVIGSRALEESEIAVSQSWYKVMLGKVGNKLTQSFLGLKISDTQCGFKGFSQLAKDVIFRHQTVAGWAFDMEILLLAKENNFKIKEVSVRWLNCPGSKVSWFDYFRVLVELFMISIRHRLIK